jgi:hypothetical protein
MSSARSSPAATLLPSGEVLVAGGYGTSGPLASTELYDPATNSWSAAGTMSAARDRHTATLLPHADVLVAGGDDDGMPLASAELYTATLSASSHESHTAGDLRRSHGRADALKLPGSLVGHSAAD